MRHFFQPVSIDLLVPLYLGLGRDYGVQVADGMLIIDSPEGISAADLDKALAGLKLQADPEPIRADRDGRLAACDWTQLADCPLPAEVKAAWAAYRQALRDLPGGKGFPNAYAWPVRPDAKPGTKADEVKLDTAVKFQRVEPAAV